MNSVVIVVAFHAELEEVVAFHAELDKMKKLVLLSALFATLCIPALAGNQGGNMGGNMGGNGGGHHGVPGPLAGAGLPIIVAGYGLYRLIRRRKPK